VLGGQSGDDLGHRFVGHRPQDSFCDHRMADAHDLCRDVRGLGGQYLGCGLCVEPADHKGESASVE
jgi:hypothetical protein